jgi:hypothetical protein
MSVVFYIVKIVYICVFMTCSTLYWICEKLMDLWNVYNMCVCICTYLIFSVYLTPKHFHKLKKHVGIPFILNKSAFNYCFAIGSNGKLV